MIDHVFIDLINAMQHSMESAMLEQLPDQEHLLSDFFLGDMHYENSYALPGEITPPNLRVDINLEWPVWTQSIYRSWTTGESELESLEMDMELVIRAINMASPAPIDLVLSALDERSTPLMNFILERSSVVLSENILGTAPANEFELEVAFEGTVLIEESALTSKETLASLLANLGQWAASLLVRLSDQPLRYLPFTSE